MDDDLVTGGILPSGVIAGDDDDPNMVESDDFLDDPEDLLLADVVDMPLDPLAAEDDEDDDLLEE